MAYETSIKQFSMSDMSYDTRVGMQIIFIV